MRGYYEVFGYTEKDHSNWESAGFPTLKEALEFYDNNKDDYFDMEVVKRTNTGEFIRRVR